MSLTEGYLHDSLAASLTGFLFGVIVLSAAAPAIVVEGHGEVHRTIRRQQFCSMRAQTCGKRLTYVHNTTAGTTPTAKNILKQTLFSFRATQKLVIHKKCRFSCSFFAHLRRTSCLCNSTIVDTAECRSEGLRTLGRLAFVTAEAVGPSVGHQKVVLVPFRASERRSLLQPGFLPTGFPWFHPFCFQQSMSCPLFPR
jgi:hypothetical protein